MNDDHRNRCPCDSCWWLNNGTIDEWRHIRYTHQAARRTTTITPQARYL